MPQSLFTLFLQPFITIVERDCMTQTRFIPRSVPEGSSLEGVAGFELDMDAVLALEKVRKVDNNFEVRDKQDLTITTAEKYSVVLEKVQQKYPDARITPVSIYQPEGVTERNITFHLEFH